MAENSEKFPNTNLVRRAVSTWIEDAYKGNNSTQAVNIIAKGYGYNLPSDGAEKAEVTLRKVPTLDVSQVLASTEAKKISLTKLKEEDGFYQYSVQVSARYTDADNQSKQVRTKLFLAYSDKEVMKPNAEMVFLPTLKAGPFISTFKRVAAGNAFDHLDPDWFINDREAKYPGFWNTLKPKRVESLQHLFREVVYAHNGLLDELVDNQSEDKSEGRYLGVPGAVTLEVLKNINWMQGYIQDNVTEKTFTLEHVAHDLDIITMGVFTSNLSGTNISRFYDSNLSFSLKLPDSKFWSEQGARHLALNALYATTGMELIDGKQVYITNSPQAVLERYIKPFTYEVDYQPAENLSLTTDFILTNLLGASPTTDYHQYQTYQVVNCDQKVRESLDDQLTREFKDDFVSDVSDKQMHEYLAKSDIKASDLTDGFSEDDEESLLDDSDLEVFQAEHDSDAVYDSYQQANEKLEQEFALIHAYNLEEEEEEIAYAESQPQAAPEFRASNSISLNAQKQVKVSVPPKTRIVSLTPAILQDASKQVSSLEQASEQVSEPVKAKAQAAKQATVQTATKSQAEQTERVEQTYPSKQELDHSYLFEHKAHNLPTLLEVLQAERDKIFAEANARIEYSHGHSTNSTRGRKRKPKTFTEVIAELARTYTLSIYPTKQGGRPSKAQKADEAKVEAFLTELMQSAALTATKKATPARVTEVALDFKRKQVESLTKLYKQPWQNTSHRLLAIVDCSKLSNHSKKIPTNAPFAKGKGKKVTYSHGSSLCIIYDSELSRPILSRIFKGNVTEPVIVKQMMEKVKELGYANAIFIFDRGYDSKEFKQFLQSHNFPFVMMSSHKLTTEKEILAAAAKRCQNGNGLNYDPHNDAYLDVHSTTFGEVHKLTDDCPWKDAVLNYITFYRPTIAHHHRRRFYNGLMKKAVNYSEGKANPTKAELDSGLFIASQEGEKTVYKLNMYVYSSLHHNTCQMMVTNIRFDDLCGLENQMLSLVRYASAIMAIYSLRWDIEILFRVMKAMFKQHGIAVRNPASLGVKIGIAIVAATIKRILERKRVQNLNKQQKNQDTHNTLIKDLDNFITGCKFLVIDGDVENMRMDVQTTNTTVNYMQKVYTVNITPLYTRAQFTTFRAAQKVNA